MKKPGHKHGTGKNYVPGCDGCKEINRAARQKSKSDPEKRALENAKAREHRKSSEYRERAASYQRERRKDPEFLLAQNASAQASQARRREKLRLRTPEQCDVDFLKLNPSGSKKCRACRQVLPMTAFARNRCVSSGRAQSCMPCATKRSRRNFGLKFDKFNSGRNVDPWVCIYCDTPLNGESREYDHFIPVSLGGPDDLENLVPACFECNRGVGGKFDSDPWEWLQSRYPHQISRLMDLIQV